MGASFFSNPTDYTVADEGGDGSGFYDGPAYTAIDPVAINDSVAEAAASASAAEGFASNSSTSAAASAASASAALASEAGVATSATNAATSASNAATSETNAAASASTATTQAGVATTKASEAATSAAAALVSEGNADTSEANAASSASAASTSASNAAASEANAAASAAASAAVAATKTSLGTIQGLNTANNASDAANDIDIAVGGARDTTNTYDMELASGITKRLDAAWAAGTNQGGLDAGSKASSTSYHIFLIRKTSDGSIDALFSTSPTNPTMPSGYGAKRRIASLKTDSSGNIQGYTQTGGYFTLKAPVEQYVSTPGTIALTTAGQLPLGVKLYAHLLAATGASPFTTAGYVMIRDPDLGVPSAVNSSTGIMYQPDSATFAQIVDVWSNASAQFYTGSAVGNPALFFLVKGWLDMRDAYQ